MLIYVRRAQLAENNIRMVGRSIEHRMVGKPAIRLLTLFCFTRSLCAQSFRTMSNYTAGLHSVAYVTVPSDEVAKKLAQ